MTQAQKQGIYVTQEDIDAALQAAAPPEMTAGVDDARPLFLDEADIVDSGGADSGDDDYFGLLSKEDIEALLHGDLDGSIGREAQDEIDTLLQDSGPGVREKPPSPAEAAPAAKSVAQEDVERLMQEAAEGRVSEAAEKAGAASQDDIDRLLMEALDGAGDDLDGDMAPEPARTDSMGTGDVLSQGDLDQLLADAAKDDREGIAPAQTGPMEAGEVLSQDDLDQLLAGAAKEDREDIAPEPAQTDIMEAGDVLSQDDLDQLLAGASQDDGEDVEPEITAAASVEMELVPEIPDDIGSIEPEMSPEAADDTESLISQSDLDQLMGADRAKEAPPGTSEHISQDDINRLLKESLEEAEVLLEEEADAVADEGDLQEPVILAAEEEPSEPSPPDSKPAPPRKTKTRKGGLKKRIRAKHLVWAAVAAGIALMVSTAAVMMSSGPTETAPPAQVLTFSLSQTGGDATGSPIPSDTRIRLPGFVVFAPPNQASVTYLAADLTLDVSDAAIVAVVKENEAFVRDIIYGTISSELMTRDISTIDEISLELAIRKALGRIMARDAIGRISFDRLELV